MPPKFSNGSKRPPAAGAGGNIDMPADGNGVPSADRHAGGNGNGHGGNGNNGSGRAHKLSGGGNGESQKAIDVMVPGQHLTKNGRVEVSETDFADSVLRALPADLLYRSAGTLG